MHRFRVFIRVTLLLAWCGTISANSYFWDDLKPPAADELFAFSNDRPPATGSRSDVDPLEIEEFLIEGRVFYRRSLLRDFLKDEGLSEIEIYDSSYFSKRGVLVTNNEDVIFWNLMSANVLRLETSDLKQCYILYLDEWTESIARDLENYQKSSREGYTGKPPTAEQQLVSYEKSREQLKEKVDKQFVVLRRLKVDSKVATGKELKRLKREFDSKRRFVEFMQHRLLKIDFKIASLRLDAEFPVESSS